MKAIIFNHFGDSSVLNTAQISEPDLSPDEVLIKNEYTSVNPVDWKIRQGHLTEMLPHKLPIIPGWDAAGKVTKIGSNVKNFKVGDRVFAYARLPEVSKGTYAEKVALPESYFAKIPANIPTEAAAGVPLVALTAFQALNDLAKVEIGDQVLITAGAGGVGSFAVQFAKARGAVVTATASAKNHGYLKELGVDHVIDYTKGNTIAETRAIAPKGYDVIFDGAGGEALKEAWELIKDGGRLVSIVDTPDEKIAAKKNVQAAFHFVSPSGKQLQEIANLLETNVVKMPTFEIRSIKEAAAAQDENEKRHVRGKVVLKIDFD